MKCPETNRRRFLKTVGNSAVVFPFLLNAGLLSGCVKRSSRPGAMVRHPIYFLENGSVFLNGRFKKADLVIENGVIARIGNEKGGPGVADTKVIDCSRFFISPGWIDYHCHLGGIGVDLDLLGPEMGITAMVEAGTYGSETFDAFMNRCHKFANIPVFVFLNVRKNGIQVKNIFFKSKPGVEDVDGARRLINQYPDVIKGLKVRLDSMNAPGENPAYLADVTAKLGRERQLPVMYHLGNPEPSIADFLKRSKPGDIITHCFRKSNNSVVDASGNMRAEARRAKAEGVLFDVGHGVGSFEFDSAKRAFDRDFMDFTISSDLWLLPSWFKSRTFANVASKFLALGLSLEDVTERISSRPRRLLTVESEIQIGRPMDLTIFSIADGTFEYVDTGGHALAFGRRILPEYTIVGGNLIRAGDRDRRLFMA
jgi:dihydroorotase